MPPGDSTENGSGNQAQIAKLGVKLPPLWRNNIKLWFVQAESNFQLSGITADLTKYNTIVAAIDPETLSAVSDILLNPPEQDKYITLKNRMIQELSDSENKNIRKLLSELHLGDDKPSHLLRKMRELAGSSISDDFLRTLFLQRLPPDMQSILSVSSESLENISKMADKIADVRADSLAGNLCAISRSSRDRMVSSDSPLNEVAALRAEIAALTKQVERLSRSQSRDRSRVRHFRSQYHSKERNAGGYCYYHERFGKKARKCREPCSFSTENPEN